jgi:hypothetical protein
VNASEEFVPLNCKPVLPGSRYPDRLIFQLFFPVKNLRLFCTFIYAERPAISSVATFLPVFNSKKDNGAIKKAQLLLRCMV